MVMRRDLATILGVDLTELTEGLLTPLYSPLRGTKSELTVITRVAAACERSAPVAPKLSFGPAFSRGSYSNSDVVTRQSF